MHENDREHISELIKDWLKRKKIQIFFACPPYFNFIENLWDELERRMKNPIKLEPL